MNEKIENLIKQEKKRFEASEKRKRTEHLIRLGLIEKDFDEYSVIEVTDEEYEEICKYFPPSKKIKEKTLRSIVLKIIVSIVLACVIINTYNYLYPIIREDKYFIETELFIRIGILITSLIVWTMSNVLVDISINVRQINNKTK